jgi:FkbM family methyltransferase
MKKYIIKQIKIIIKFFRRILNYIESKVDNSSIRINNSISDWEMKFNKQDYFDFEFNDKTKIRLYKDSVLSKLIYDGFETDEINFIKKELKIGDIFIDIGANIGLFTLIASNAVGENGKVISFEPSPITFSRLKENFQLNGVKNVDARNIGLSDKIGCLNFYVSNNGYDAWNSFAMSKDDKLLDMIQVNVSTLDIELNEIDKKLIKLIKLDVEGWEKYVLNGGIELLKNYSPTLMVEFTEQNTFNAGYYVQDLFEILENIGYKWYRITNGELKEEIKRLHYPYDNLIAQKIYEQE